MFKCFQCVLVLVVGGLKGVRVCGIVVYWDPNSFILSFVASSVTALVIILFAIQPTEVTCALSWNFIWSVLNTKM
jgi:hypothetical protein